MIVSACQPYFAPFPGFLAKALLSDVLVLFDAVQFPQRTTWLTRNRFKGDQGELWMTIPVHRSGLGLQRIDAVRVSRGGRWSRKHLASLKAAYARAPFFEEHLPFLERLFGHVPERLVDLNLAVIRYLAAQFEVAARILLQSELGVVEREPQLSVEICRALGGRTFLAQRAAAKFLNPEPFAAAGIEFRTIALHPQVYPQLHGPFTQNLSAFDLLFTCGPKAPAILRRWLLMSS
jgi:hypothetical protein